MATSPHDATSVDATSVDANDRGPTLTALDPPLTPYALVGVAIWAVVGLVSLTAVAPTHWGWTSLAGVLIGAGLASVGWYRERRQRRRRALDQPAG